MSPVYEPFQELAILNEQWKSRLYRDVEEATDPWTIIDRLSTLVVQDAPQVRDQFQQEFSLGFLILFHAQVYLSDAMALPLYWKTTGSPTRLLQEPLEPNALSFVANGGEYA